MNKITTVIFDWAGTTVDYGSFAPVDAFLAAFKAFGITPTIDETRAPMGLPKRDHIALMLAGERLANQWLSQHGRSVQDQDIDTIYQRFEPALFDVLPAYAQPLPGVIDTVQTLREMGIAIGSTTGYTEEMMDVLAPLARDADYAPDSLVCPDAVGGVGRPYPYMLWRNLELLGTLSINQVLKVGDTAADIAEGKNAGVLSIGILTGSSMVGLSAEEIDQLNTEQIQARFKLAEQGYFAAGADYVLESISKLPELIMSLG